MKAIKIDALFVNLQKEPRAWVKRLAKKCNTTAEAVVSAIVSKAFSDRKPQRRASGLDETQREMVLALTLAGVSQRTIATRMSRTYGRVVTRATVKRYLDRVKGRR